jgi:hypothetical protein
LDAPFELVLLFHDDLLAILDVYALGQTVGLVDLTSIKRIGLFSILAICTKVIDASPA